MQDLLVQIQSIYAKPEDLIILTFSKEVNFEDINDSITAIAKHCPDLKFVANREDFVKNITVIETPIKPIIHYDWSPCKDGD